MVKSKVFVWQEDNNESLYNKFSIGVKKLLEEKNLCNIRQVLLKPNLVIQKPSYTGVTTDIGILKILINILKTYNIDKIYIGESSLADTEYVFKKLGIYEFEKYDIKVINFEKDKWEIIKSPLGMIIKEFLLPKTVLESDLIFNIAKIKTHNMTTVSLSIKNFYGCLSKGTRKSGHILGIDDAIVDIFSYFAKYKNIVAFLDGIVALEGSHGPTTGNPVYLKCILASDDCVALDSVGTKIMGYESSKNIKHIALSDRYKLGNMKNIEIIGENIDKIKKEFKLPQNISSNIPLVQKLLDRFFLKQPYSEKGSVCQKCGYCARVCPMDCIIIDDEPKIDYRKCIGCLCCFESCAHGTLNYTIRNRGLYNILINLKKKGEVE